MNMKVKSGTRANALTELNNMINKYNQLKANGATGNKLKNAKNRAEKARLILDKM